MVWFLHTALFQFLDVNDIGKRASSLIGKANLFQDRSEMMHYQCVLVLISLTRVSSGKSEDS